MIPGWKDYLARQEHFEDLRREAEVERLLRRGRPSPERRWLAATQVLAWLGQRLETWGSRLQAQAQMRSQMPDCCTAEC